MPVRVRCPNCGAVCQIGDEHAGKQAKCGQCARAFLVPAAGQPVPLTAAADPVVSPAIPPTTPAQQAAPQPANTVPQALVQPLAGLWTSLRGMVRSMTAPRSPATPEEEVTFELDGPAAAALEGTPQTRKQPGPRGLAPLVGVCRLDIGAATSPGCVRPRNEDSFLVQQLAWSNLDQRHEAAILVVADGMGGYEAGDRASGLVLRVVGGAVLALFGDLLAGKAPPAPSGFAALIDSAIKAANRLVHQKGQTEPGCKGMGATAAVVLVCDSQVYIGHVGDCRVYHYRAGKLTQVTRDQTLVARMVELGKLTPQEALTHPSRNEVTQALGRHPDIHPAASQLALAPEDWLVIACDGLHAHVDEKKLVETLQDAAPSAAVLAHQLVDLANEGGGTDNCTVLAVRCY